MCVGLAACRGDKRQRSDATRYGVFLAARDEGAVAQKQEGDLLPVPCAALSSPRHLRLVYNWTLGGDEQRVRGWMVVADTTGEMPMARQHGGQTLVVLGAGPKGVRTPA